MIKPRTNYLQPLFMSFLLYPVILAIFTSFIGCTGNNQPLGNQPSSSQQQLAPQTQMPISAMPQVSHAEMPLRPQIPQMPQMPLQQQIPSNMPLGSSVPNMPNTNLDNMSYNDMVNYYYLEYCKNMNIPPYSSYGANQPNLQGMNPTGMPPAARPMPMYSNRMAGMYPAGMQMPLRQPSMADQAPMHRPQPMPIAPPTTATPAPQAVPNIEQPTSHQTPAAARPTPHTENVRAPEASSSSAHNVSADTEEVQILPSTAGPSTASASRAPMPQPTTGGSADSSEEDSNDPPAISFLVTKGPNATIQVIPLPSNVSSGSAASATKGNPQKSTAQPGSASNPIEIQESTSSTATKETNPAQKAKKTQRNPAESIVSVPHTGKYFDVMVVKSTKGRQKQIVDTIKTVTKANQAIAEEIARKRKAEQESEPTPGPSNPKKARQSRQMPRRPNPKKAQRSSQTPGPSRQAQPDATAGPSRRQPSPESPMMAPPTNSMGSMPGPSSIFTMQPLGGPIMNPPLAPTSSATGPQTTMRVHPSIPPVPINVPIPIIETPIVKYNVVADMQVKKTAENNYLISKGQELRQSFLSGAYREYKLTDDVLYDQLHYTHIENTSVLDYITPGYNPNVPLINNTGPDIADLPGAIVFMFGPKVSCDTVMQWFRDDQQGIFYVTGDYLSNVILYTNRKNYAIHILYNNYQALFNIKAANLAYIKEHYKIILLWVDERPSILTDSDWNNIKSGALNHKPQMIADLHSNAFKYLMTKGIRFINRKDILPTDRCIFIYGATNSILNRLDIAPYNTTLIDIYLNESTDKIVHLDFILNNANTLRSLDFLFSIRHSSRNELPFFLPEYIQTNKKETQKDSQIEKEYQRNISLENLCVIVIPTSFYNLAKETYVIENVSKHLAISEYV
ncbi:hypothetical protein NEOKW01_0134 [Nematocida sp. AWRm80]|nr:hypothetical protein NEOKW01_0134 [Nematocida sp. AWRm80]